MGICYECDFGVGFKVTMNEEYSDILEAFYDDLCFYIEEKSNGTDFRPLYFQEGSKMAFAVVYEKSLEEIASDFLEAKNKLLSFINENHLVAHGDFDVVGGIFTY